MYGVISCEALLWPSFGATQVKQYVLSDDRLILIHFFKLLHIRMGTDDESNWMSDAGSHVGKVIVP